MKVIAVFILCISAIADADVGSTVSIGNQLHQAYTEYHSLPVNVSTARSLGWRPTGQPCVAGVGIPYAKGPVGSNPTFLHFTASGDVSGVSVYASGDLPSYLTSRRFWLSADDGMHFLSLGFRDPTTVCSNETPALGTPPASGSFSLGDRVVLNPQSIAMEIPLTDTAAAAAGYFKGSCFNTMGTHWFRDLAAAPGTMSWNATTVLPITPMYHNGAINAVLVNTWNVQQGLSGAHGWDPIPLLNTLMCKNLCSSDCHWDGTTIWSTMHLYFRDYTDVKCGGGCTIGCCPGS
eukprot:TRINITY_DN366_c0_g1_i1.p1 TRINITY_DN366_c0_g1~~TRINITY_DN366_c0_g1_i1.p1  ORF type:complete len:291 (+),score=23.32 TRINITY_DN366_c0_g1_i1:90-962(+)